MSEEEYTRMKFKSNSEMEKNSLIETYNDNNPQPKSTNTEDPIRNSSLNNRNENISNLIKRFQSDTSQETQTKTSNNLYSTSDIPNVNSLGSDQIEVKPRPSTQQRNSAHRRNILNKMKSTIANTYESVGKSNAEILKPCLSVPLIQHRSEEEISPRPSVRDLIKMNESRLKTKQSPDGDKRNTMSTYPSNEIRERIRRLLEENNRDVNSIDMNDSFIRDKILQMGIHDRDFKHLVDFFNKEIVTGQQNKNKPKERNTINYMKHGSQLNPLRIAEIKEEKEEDKSIKSENSRISDISREEYIPDIEVDYQITEEEQPEILLNDKNMAYDITSYNNFDYESNMTKQSSYQTLEISKVVYKEPFSPKIKRLSSKESNLEVNNVNDIQLEPIKKKPSYFRIESSENIIYLSNDTDVRQSLNKSESTNVKTQNIDLNILSKVFLEDKTQEYTKSHRDKHVELSNQDHTKYQKNIINSLDSIAIIQYTINPNLPLDPTFYDILCIHCYECVKPTEVDEHSEYCIIHPEDYTDLYFRSEADEDYNARIYKLHESLKKKRYDIYKANSVELNTIYNNLLSLVYEILINNNSIEDLEKTISKINDIINNKLIYITSNFKFSLLIYAKRISQLVYIKLNEMEKLLVYIKNKQVEVYDEDEYLKEDDDNDDPEIEDRLQTLKMELANIEKQTEVTKLEVEKWRKEAKLRENMLARPSTNIEILSDINSEVYSRREESFDGMTMVSGITTEFDNDIAYMRDVNEELESKSEEEMKKYFLQLGLTLKFKYAERINNNNVSLADIYDKIRENNIQHTDWQDFILKELNIS